MVLPAYLLRAGLGSNVSRWLTPPSMNSQITRFARGAKCGLPSGWFFTSAARATPSRKSMAPRARPVKPMPTSARKVRRLTRPQQWAGGAGWNMAASSADSDEVVVVEQHLDEVFAGPLGGVGGGRRDG